MSLVASYPLYLVKLSSYIEKPNVIMTRDITGLWTFPCLLSSIEGSIPDIPGAQRLFAPDSTFRKHLWYVVFKIPSYLGRAVGEHAFDHLALNNLLSSPKLNPNCYHLANLIREKWLSAPFKTKTNLLTITDAAAFTSPPAKLLLFFMHTSHNTTAVWIQTGRQWGLPVTIQACTHIRAQYPSAEFRLDERMCLIPWPHSAAPSQSGEWMDWHHAHSNLSMFSWEHAYALHKVSFPKSYVTTVFARGAEVGHSHQLFIEVHRFLPCHTPPTHCTQTLFAFPIFNRLQIGSLLVSQSDNELKTVPGVTLFGISYDGAAQPALLVNAKPILRSFSHLLGTCLHGIWNSCLVRWLLTLPPSIQLKLPYWRAAFALPLSLSKQTKLPCPLLQKCSTSCTSMHSRATRGLPC